MINAVVIEDEKPALENLVSTLLSISDDVEVIARLGSVEESIEYFSLQPAVDLIFSDVQLGDGLSFEIFTQSGLRIPVIFITGYDEFMLHAFEHNGIDYLLKPVEKESLRNALNKYRMLEKHFMDHQSISKLLQYISGNKKYFADQNLGEMEKELDETIFFRANRQYIININFVQGFKIFEKVKLIVELTLPDLNHRIIISQEVAPQFKEWLHNA